jgi:hypothetical protein
MTVIAWREVVPRTLSHRFGDAPTAEAKVIVTVDEPTPTQTVIDAVGVVHGTPHPEYSFLRMLDASLTELDRQHVEITYRYELPKQQDLEPNPLARPDVWTFSTGGAQVPALAYYDGSGNSNRKPLQNSAKDYVWEGLTVSEAEVRASISSNRSQFPLSVAAAVTNTVNASAYLNGASHTWFCSGISGQQAVEVVNGAEIRYWQITAELIYRQSGHDLALPDVGYHYISGGKRKRAMVEGESAGEQVPASTPVPLTSSGGLKPDGSEPDILVRRVYPEIDFSSFFGTPPF